MTKKETNTIIVIGMVVGWFLGFMTAVAVLVLLLP